MYKSEDIAFPESLIHYTEDDDPNRILCHNRSEDIGSKIARVLEDAAMLITACGSCYDESSKCQLLIRVSEEQTDKDSDGKRTLKSKFCKMQSPAPCKGRHNKTCETNFIPCGAAKIFRERR